MELLDHQVTIRVQGVRAALHEIAIRHLIEMVKEIADKDEIVLLVLQVVCQSIPGTMYDTITHSLLREDRCWKTDFLWQIEHN